MLWTGYLTWMILLPVPRKPVRAGSRTEGICAPRVKSITRDHSAKHPAVCKPAIYGQCSATLMQWWVQDPHLLELAAGLVLEDVGSLHGTVDNRAQGVGLH